MTQQNIGKGFKRIYFILCGIFGLLLLIEIRNHNFCLNSEFPELCSLSYGDTLISTIVENLIIFSLTIPIYYLIRWVYLGFKK